jgi:hypothetical protein
VRLRRVLDDYEPVAARDLDDRVDVRHQSVQMDRQNRFCAGRDCHFHQVRIHRPGIRIDVDKDRLCSAIKDCRRRRDKRHRHRDHLVARTDSGRKQRQMKGRSAAVERNALFGTAICRETFLKRSDFRPKVELGAVEDAGDRGIDFRLDLPVLRFQIKKWYHWVRPSILPVALPG